MAFVVGCCVISQSYAIELLEEEASEILRFAETRTVSDVTLWLRENSADDKLHDPDFVSFLAVLPVLRSPEIATAVAQRDDVWKLTTTAALSGIAVVPRDQYYNDMLACMRDQIERLESEARPISMELIQAELESNCFGAVAEIIRGRMHSDCGDIKGEMPALCRGI